MCGSQPQEGPLRSLLPRPTPGLSLAGLSEERDGGGGGENGEEPNS